MNDETFQPKEPIRALTEEAAFFFAQYHDRALKKKKLWDWLTAKIWLIEAGFIEDDRPPARQVDSRSTTFGAGQGRNSRDKKDAVRRKAVISCLEDIEEQEYEWLWPGRFPNRTVSMIAGDGGAGKSTLTGHLAAVVTTGGAWPDLPGIGTELGSVVLLSAEENPATDLRRRYRKFGADASKVHILSAMQASDGIEDRFLLTRDIPALSEAVAEIGDVRLVMIDPIGSYLSGSDTGNDAEVQHALTPLFALAEAHRLAIVLVAHLTKNSSSDIQSRIQGSAAFVNKSRMVWFYSQDPRNHSLRLLSFIKGNPVDKVTTALSIGFNGDVLSWDPEPVYLSAKQVAARLAQQALRGEMDSKPGPKTERTKELMDFLELRLADGAMLRTELVDQAKDALDAKRGTVWDAIKKLGDKVHLFEGDDNLMWIELTPELDLGDLPAEETPNDAHESPSDAPESPNA